MSPAVRFCKREAYVPKQSSRAQRAKDTHIHAGFHQDASVVTVGNAAIRVYNSSGPDLHTLTVGFEKVGWLHLLRVARCLRPGDRRRLKIRSNRAGRRTSLEGGNRGFRACGSTGKPVAMGICVQ